mmetsp:Transcript_9333/g.26672  ORF Transcript_9333/g.26672 Transcript_9333/m.26672 type:complete len:418 (-) Transcript_9333:464-1717(-)
MIGFGNMPAFCAAASARLPLQLAAIQGRSSPSHHTRQPYRRPFQFLYSTPCPALETGSRRLHSKSWLSLLPPLNASSSLDNGSKDELEQAANHEEGDVFMGLKGDAQLFGMKGAVHGSREPWKLHLQLMKPAAWAPLLVSICYGVSSAGQFAWEPEQLEKLFVAWLMAGPCLAGFNQTMNDYYDRDIDAINEPYRPIPSGAVSLEAARLQIFNLLGLGMAFAAALDLWTGHDTPSITALCGLGALMSYAYSVPFIKLKKNGWLGGLAMAFTYIAMPWWVGELLYVREIPSETVALSLLLGLSAIGTSIVNDFKSTKGDAELGLRSIPVMYGELGAKWVTVAMTNVPQAAAALYLLEARDQPVYAGIVLLCLLAQAHMQWKYLFKGDILKNDVSYMAHANPFQCLAIIAVSSALSVQL